MTFENELCKVVNVFERTIDSLVIAKAGNEAIETTPEHPFWVIGKGWTEAQFLRSGLGLRGFNSDIVVIQEIEIENRAERVYNFEVERLHNYYVSSVKLLVHNNCMRNGKAALNTLDGATDQFRSLQRAQQAARKAGNANKIYSTRKTTQRLDNALKNIRNLRDATQ